MKIPVLIFIDILKLSFITIVQNLPKLQMNPNLKQNENHNNYFKVLLTIQFGCKFEKKNFANTSRFHDVNFSWSWPIAVMSVTW